MNYLMYMNMILKSSLMKFFLNYVKKNLMNQNLGHLFNIQ